MKLTFEKMEELVKAWEGHIEQAVDCRDCAVESHECPIHKFFMDMKRQLKIL